jgi:NADPH:quinone reductase-like Zn-dependent oxidoreductase
MAAIPKTMKSWIVVKNGVPADALTLKADVAVPPTPTGSNIIVKVSYVALNPADLHFMANIPSWLPFRRNATPGLDFAGEVVQVGPSAQAKLRVGTEVCASMGVSQVASGNGSLAEYVVVPADLVAVKPSSLSMAAAAGLAGVAGQTAAIMIRESNVKKGDKALINGASGGVGSVLLQILKARGAVVTAICSKANEEFVRRLGADEVSSELGQGCPL